MGNTTTQTISAFADVASVVSALAAVVIGYFSIRLASRSLMHNKLSARPIPQILFADYDNLLRVKIRNEGAGPLIIRAVSVSDGTESKDDVFSWMPVLPAGITWSNYSSIFADRTVLTGNELILLELDNRNKEFGAQKFNKFRDLCRAQLAPLTVCVTYTDVYDSRFEPRCRALDWFSREKGTRRKAKVAAAS